MQDKYTAFLEILQEKKEDEEKEFKFFEKKNKTEHLAEVYSKLGKEKKSKRVFNCGTYLVFSVVNGIRKLIEANFCEVRLCPMCLWRRSLKVFAHVSKIMDAAEKEKYKYIFLTLTVKNCKGEDLKANLDLILESFKRMFDRPNLQKFIKGWFRGLEITYNDMKYITGEMYNNEKMKKYYDSKGLKVGDKNPNYDTFHPHVHMILAVKGYGSRNYLEKMDWVNIWQECLRVDYAPNVYIETIGKDKKSIKKAVAEIAKYTVKDGDFLKPDINLSAKIVDIIDGALFKRRLIAYGGRFKELHKELNLDDEEKGSLKDVENIEIREDLNEVIEKYGWFIGALGKNYYKIN